MIAPTLTKTTSTTDGILTAADRCDQCGARAWVRVTMSSGDLFFCAHHCAKHMDALRTQAVEILDERHLMSED